MSTELLELESVTDTDADLLDTPEIEMPIPPPDALRATIEAVTEQTFDTGSVGIVVSLKGIDVALGGPSETYTIFPPVEFVENAAEFFAGTMTGADLSEVVPAGKKQSPRQRYGAVISNTDGDAEIQKLRTIAKNAGRKPTARPVDFTTFVETLNELLAGVEVVVTRRADEKNENPAFRRTLKIRGIFDISVVNDPKALKNYTKLWD